MAILIASYSEEAEKSVLGSVLLDHACLRQVAETIDATDFYTEAHQEIFRNMLSLRVQRKPIDLTTLVHALKESESLEAIGGAPYLAELVDVTPTSANVAYYSRIVKEKAAARKLANYGVELANMVAQGGDLQQILAGARETLNMITGSLDGLSGVSAKDILTFEARQARYTSYVESLERTRFKTGFSCIDAVIRGVAPGEVMTIIAYSGTYKSALLQSLLLRGVEATGQYHMFFSMEMPVQKVFEREIQMQGGISGSDVERHYKRARHSEGVRAAIERRGSHGLLLCDRPRLTLEKIGRYIDLAQQKYGPIGAVGVDYLGLMQAPGKTVYEKTAHVAIETKNLAKELNVPIILLCQINRAAATTATAGGEVEMYSAKGAGDIESAADFMLGLQLDAQGQLICKILKNRNGPVGAKLLVHLNRGTFEFHDMSAYLPEKTKTSKSIPF